MPPGAASDIAGAPGRELPARKPQPTGHHLNPLATPPSDLPVFTREHEMTTGAESCTLSAILQDCPVKSSCPRCARNCSEAANHLPKLF